MVTVHVEGSAKEVREELLALFATSANAPSAPTPASDAKPAKAAKKDAPAEETAKEPAAQTSEELKVEDVPAKVAELLKKHPRPKVVELIASFGAKKGSEIAPEKWGEFMKKADELK